jgi:hypothetical protein
MWFSYLREMVACHERAESKRTRVCSKRWLYVDVVSAIYRNSKKVVLQEFETSEPWSGQITLHAGLFIVSLYHTFSHYWDVILLSLRL